VVGERILNRFVIQDRLGSGGFGTVYRAWDERLEREVAVKAFDGHGATDPRVLREAQAAARLNHPGIVTLYELGGDSRQTYLVSELVNGDTLGARAELGDISDRDIAEIGADVCDALAHAHEHGVVHRDVKPQNILVADNSGRAKVMDFGIAHVLGGEPLTAAGDVIGTIAYMSPEQAEGEVVGPPSDVYSLAVTLYECWAGVQPVARGTPAATVRAIGKGVEPLGRVRSDLPEHLTMMIDACLAPEPWNRPELEELADVLDEMAPHLSREPLGPIAERGVPQGPAKILHHPAVGPALSALAIGTLATVALTDAGLTGFPLLLPFLAAAVAAVMPRLAYLAVAGGLVLWLASAGDMPGAALIVALLTMPQVMLFPNEGRLWPLPALAPMLGAIGLAPLYAGCAGLCSTASRRFLFGVLGYLWLLVAEGAWRTTLLFGIVDPARHGWAEKPAVAGHDLLLPLLTTPALLGAAVWGIAAVCLAPLIRGRAVSLELLGVLVWAAALLSAQRTLSHVGEAAPPAAGGIVAGLSLLVVLALLYRSASPARPRVPQLGGEGPTLHGEGGELRLP
jgi:hypothetical protein